MDLKFLDLNVRKMPAITRGTRSSDRSSDSLSDSAIYRKEILYNNIYLRVESLVLHDLVAQVFPGRMVIPWYCIATDLFSGFRTFEKLSEYVSFHFNVAKFQRRYLEEDSTST